MHRSGEDALFISFRKSKEEPHRRESYFGASEVYGLREVRERLLLITVAQFYSTTFSFYETALLAAITENVSVVCGPFLKESNCQPSLGISLGNLRFSRTPVQEVVL